MSDLTNAQRAIKLREIEMEIIALEEGRSPYGFRLSQTQQSYRDKRKQVQDKIKRRKAILQGEKPRMDWGLAWENYDYIIRVNTTRNAERFKAVNDALSFLWLEKLHRSMGDVVMASSYADRAWSITTSLGYSAYRDEARCADKNPFEDEKLKNWFEYGWKQRENCNVGVHGQQTLDVFKKPETSIEPA